MPLTVIARRRSLIPGILALAGMFFVSGLGGCQTARTDGDISAHVSQARLLSAHGATSPQGQGRVHILLAREVDLPFDIRSKHVSLGAGDELGKQMFQRYASLVRAQQRRDDRVLVMSGDGDDKTDHVDGRSVSYAWLSLERGSAQ